MKSIIVALAMMALLAGTAAARDQFDGNDYRYGADAYSIRENQAAEQRHNAERQMEDQRREMQQQQIQQQNSNILGMD